MTRKEIKQDWETYVNDNTNPFTNKLENQTVKNMFDFIDEWMDDFENRTCENCEYISVYGFCINYKSIGYGKNIVEDYEAKKDGCNKFKPKE